LTTNANYSINSSCSNNTCEQLQRQQLQLKQAGVESKPRTLRTPAAEAAEAEAAQQSELANNTSRQDKNFSLRQIMGGLFDATLLARQKVDMSSQETKLAQVSETEEDGWAVIEAASSGGETERAMEVECAMEVEQSQVFEQTGVEQAGVEAVDAVEHTAAQAGAGAEETASPSAADILRSTAAGIMKAAGPLPRDGAGRVATGRRRLELLCGALTEAGVRRGAEGTQAGVNAYCGWVQTTCFDGITTDADGAALRAEARGLNRAVEALCAGQDFAGWEAAAREIPSESEGEASASSDGGMEGAMEVEQSQQLEPADEGESASGGESDEESVMSDDESDEESSESASEDAPGAKAEEAVEETVDAADFATPTEAMEATEAPPASMGERTSPTATPPQSPQPPVPQLPALPKLPAQARNPRPMAARGPAVRRKAQPARPRSARGVESSLGAMTECFPELSRAEAMRLLQAYNGDARAAVSAYYQVQKHRAEQRRRQLEERAAREEQRRRELAWEQQRAREQWRQRELRERVHVPRGGFFDSPMFGW
jgi:hypothetical protein